ncbi:hypothetical protein KVR01_009231 [Diaporthe batatas]|uniref:uncharacterized protein n=1 Tax=Diaporthe batatas TaxID=748121 RepID=UPI001D040184|nr:uncharacterized protein KVR01_009231 [Diaporthe batatas]KAG8160967.1 hypothetical protein KVR01_009231 [Diaporthe batatas]
MSTSNNNNTHSGILAEDFDWIVVPDPPQVMPLNDNGSISDGVGGASASASSISVHILKNVPHPEPGTLSDAIEGGKLRDSIDLAMCPRLPKGKSGDPETRQSRLAAQYTGPLLDLPELNNAGAGAGTGGYDILLAPCPEGSTSTPLQAAGEGPARHPAHGLAPSAHEQRQWQVTYDFKLYDPDEFDKTDWREKLEPTAGGGSSSNRSRRAHTSPFPGPQPDGSRPTSRRSSLFHGTGSFTVSVPRPEWLFPHEREEGRAAGGGGGKRGALARTFSMSSLKDALKDMVGPVHDKAERKGRPRNSLKPRRNRNRASGVPGPQTGGVFEVHQQQQGGDKVFAFGADKDNVVVSVEPVEPTSSSDGDEVEDSDSDSHSDGPWNDRHYVRGPFVHLNSRPYEWNGDVLRRRPSAGTS